MICDMCERESEKKVCDECLFMLNNGADKESIRKMMSEDFMQKISNNNGKYAEDLADAYYDSVIEEYKDVEDTKENFGYNTFFDGIKMGLDIIIPILDQKQRDDVHNQIESMIKYAKEQKKK